MADDTVTGGEELSIDEAAKAYAATMSKEPEGQPDDEESAEATTDDAETPEGEDAEGGDTEGEDGQADEQDDAEPETEKGRYVAHNGRVRLPDGTESTVADLIQGNLRDRDYRQKTMATAEEKKALTSQSEAIKQREQQHEQNARHVADLLRSIIPAEPDPSMLDQRSANFDPITFTQQKEARARWVQHLQYLDQQAQQADKTRSDEASAKSKEHEAAEWATLLEKMPALKDRTRLNAFGADIVKHGTSDRYGFTREELQQALTQDHRYALVLADAIEWRKLQASKPNVAKKVEGRPAVTRGGKRLSPAESNARGATDALNRLKDTGRLDDAVAALLATSKSR